MWHDQYSITHTVAFGKVAARSTSKIIEIGSSKRHWVDVKHIKYGKRLHVSKEKTKKQLMIYAKARLDKAKVHRNKLKNLSDACAAWGDEYEKLSLGIEEFGVYVDALNMPAVLKQYFLCCI